MIWALEQPDIAASGKCTIAAPSDRACCISRRISRPFSRTSGEIRLWAVAILIGGLLMRGPCADVTPASIAHPRTTRAISTKTSSPLACGIA